MKICRPNLCPRSAKILLCLLLVAGAALTLRAQTVIIGNYVNSDTFYLGARSGSPAGLLLTYDDSSADAVTQHANRVAGWLWENFDGTSTLPAMRLDQSNNLLLYNLGSEGVKLNPVARSLTLGGSSGAVISNPIGTTIVSVNGGFTANGNMNFTGADGSLALSSSGVVLSAVGGNKSVTLSPSGSGVIALMGNVGIGTGSPGAKLDVNGGVNLSANGYELKFLNSLSGVTHAFSSDSSGNFTLTSAGATVFENLYAGGTRYTYFPGSIGVGTTNPGSKIEANGMIRVTGGGAPATNGAGLELSANGLVGIVEAYNRGTGGMPLYLYGYPTILNANGGNVGIGTTSPSAQLDIEFPDNTWAVKGRRAGTNLFGIHANGSNPVTFETFGARDLKLQTNSGWGAYVYLGSNGKVGIGTTSPGNYTSKLEVVDNSDGNVRVSVGSSAPSGNSGFQFLSGSTFAGGLFRNVTTNNISLWSMSDGSNPRITVQDSTGNVGIGTASPNEQLEIASSTGGRFIVSDGGGSGRRSLILQGPTATNNYAMLSAYSYGSGTYIPITIQPNGGNVGIGTTSPTGKLHILSNNQPSLTGGATSGITVTNQITSGTEMAMGADLSGAPFEGWIQVRHASNGTAYPLALNPLGGSVGIGTTNPGSYKLAVNGTIRAKEVIVDTGWSDYVFDDNYRLAPLSEVEQQIKADKHLPGIPSAQEVAAHGVTVGDMQSKLLAKIEELTLHQIEQEKRLDRLEQENRELRARVAQPGS